MAASASDDNDGGGVLRSEDSVKSGPKRHTWPSRYITPRCYIDVLGWDD